MINDLRIGEAWSLRRCPGWYICGGVLLRQGSVAARGLVFNGPLLLAIQGAARMPLAFPVLDVVNRLPAGGAAVTSRVAERDHGVFVAARSIAQGEGKKNCCVTTRRRKFGVFNILGQDLTR